MPEQSCWVRTFSPVAGRMGLPADAPAGQDWPFRASVSGGMATGGGAVDWQALPLASSTNPESQKQS